jgi:hypothetical protein
MAKGAEGGPSEAEYRHHAHGFLIMLVTAVVYIVLVAHYCLLYIKTDRFVIHPTEVVLYTTQQLDTRFIKSISFSNNSCVAGPYPQDTSFASHGYLSYTANTSTYESYFLLPGASIEAPPNTTAVLPGYDSYQTFLNTGVILSGSSSSYLASAPIRVYVVALNPLFSWKITTRMLFVNISCEYGFTYEYSMSDGGQSRIFVLQSLEKQSVIIEYNPRTNFTIPVFTVSGVLLFCLLGIAIECYYARKVHSTSYITLYAQNY